MRVRRRAGTSPGLRAVRDTRAREHHDRRLLAVRNVAQSIAPALEVATATYGKGCDDVVRTESQARDGDGLGAADRLRPGTPLGLKADATM
ncbi:hypothetical protein GCM10029976_032660 [Kribbella albertanoniae]